ncbi:MAG: 3',5'-cyclic-nucleotide phosphodiesterase, partial [Planctomycetes bacterium]|nr:3',5'-cyclic-nucleotide phosphodiesterase [Planctomycetota bacterium]
GPNDEFWRQVNGVQKLRYLIIETAFSNREQDLAVTARHLYPIQLGEELAKLQRETEILITHLKPSDQETIEKEIQAWAGRHSPRILERGDVFEI